MSGRHCRRARVEKPDLVSKDRTIAPVGVPLPGLPARRPLSGASPAAASLIASSHRLPNLEFLGRSKLRIITKWLFLLVQLGGLEPPTSCSTDRRSNQLSYNCILHESPRKRGSRMGRKLGATPRFGKATEHPFIVVLRACEVHLPFPRRDRRPVRRRGQTPLKNKKPGLAARASLTFRPIDQAAGL